MTPSQYPGSNTSEPVTPEVRAYAAVTGVVLLLLMFFGVLMRMTQGQWLGIGPDLFYQIMTAHGIGMVAIVTLGGMAVIWHFMGRHLALHRAAAIANLVLFLVGVVAVLASIFLGGYAAAWTMLYPLSSHSLRVWSDLAASGYLVGVLLVGVGMLVFYLEIARAIATQYEGGFKAALGWKRLRTGNKEDAPPPAIIAGAVCTIGNVVGTLFGAVILVMMLIHVFFPQFAFSALLAKNFIFLFGHVVINVAIYMAVVAVY
ncbi:MAG: cbb3-type cytochrome c oxidase subunit I, partial [Nitrococcus sp.]|nr:cbb3-type cytochrome c oxidase subunit I [Nitrococcus sp.]